MSDTINNNQGGNNNQSNIMKELSDIKTSLAVNTNETQTIKDSVNEVKGDVKEMKKNYITQDQHKELVNICQDHEIRLRNAEQRIWLSAGGLTILIFLAPYIISIFTK